MKSPFQLLLLAFMALLPLAAASYEAVSFERLFQLEGDGCSDLRWTVDLESLQITLQWTSSVDAEWTAFGISENGGMKGADIALIKHLPDDSFEVQDMYSDKYGLPTQDLVTNVELLEATHDDEGRMVVTIRRDLETCDGQDIKLEPHRQYLICASGQLSSESGALYHGPSRAGGLVNLMLDEALLFERNLVPPLANETLLTYLGEGITIHGDLETAMTPIPVDVQMPNISLRADEPTNYRCKVFNFSQPLKFTAYEGVMDQGKTARGGYPNDLLHHSFLYRCDDPASSKYVSEHIDGTVWDCVSEMPPCDVVAAFGRGTGIMETPAGLHFPLDAGVHVLLVHYENPYGQVVENETSGMRLWVEPPAINATDTKPAQVASHDPLFESLVIPADPEQKEITLQYLISAEATKATLPPGGVQAFGSVLHMHSLGIRGNVKLIRNGTHVMDVYNHKSYDFDRQTPEYTRWRLLPGDALIVSCVFKPLVDRTVVGGYKTTDEMCSFHAGWAPHVPQYGRGMGLAVVEGQPFGNTHAGEIKGLAARHLPYKEYKYPPVPKNAHDFKPLADHKKNICSTFVSENLAINPPSYADPAIYAQFVIISAFVVVALLSSNKLLGLMGINTATCGLREQRNAVVYIGQLVFSTVVLPFLCYELSIVFDEKDTLQAVDPNQHIVSRGIMMTQALLYLLELFYRIDTRGSLVFHHLMTSFTVIYLNVVFMHTYQFLALKFGLGMILLAVTEQPLYIVLLLRIVGYGKRAAITKAWSSLCRLACLIFVASRVVVVFLMAVLLAHQSKSSDLAWGVVTRSFEDWHDGSSSWLTNPTSFNAMLMILLVGILLSNAFAVKAMLHMARLPPSAVHEKQGGTSFDLEASGRPSRTEDNDSSGLGCSYEANA